MSSRYVGEWLAKAANDLSSARILLENPSPITDTAAFHAQQAVEKVLKAYLIFHDKEISKTHAIGDLIIDCINIDSAFSTMDRPEIKHLTRYAVAGRYPGEFHIPSQEEAKRVLLLAEEVDRFVRERL